MPAHAMFIIGIVWLIFAWNDCNCIKKRGWSKYQSKLGIEDHDYKEFFTCLSSMQRHEWIATELHQRNVLGIKTLENDAFIRLIKTSLMLAKPDNRDPDDFENRHLGMINNHPGFIQYESYNYEILTNPEN